MHITMPMYIDDEFFDIVLVGIQEICILSLFSLLEKLYKFPLNFVVGVNMPPKL